MRDDIVRNLVTSLVLQGKIVTSRAKARAVKHTIDRILARVAKKPVLAVRRELLGYLYNPKAVAKIFELITPNLKDRSGGFVQVFNLPPRRRDSTDQTMLVLLPELLEEKKNTDTRKQRTVNTKKEK